METTAVISSEVLNIDAEAEIDRIAAAIRKMMTSTLKRRGLVVGISGGIDSSVSAALAVKALGRDRVFGLLMPEDESTEETTRLGRLLTAHLDIQMVVENITPILEGAGCYRRRDEAIRTVVPGYGPGYRCKIVLPDVLDSDAYRISSLVVQSPDGKQWTTRLTTEAYLGIVAATNFKQRTRKMMEYYHADRLNYAVVGTPNRLEYDQGFFVKNGDGAADVKPIAHLYKTQVYALAACLGLPQIICEQTPTTDTYSLAQTQDEFYFSLPHHELDLCLYGRNHAVTPAAVATTLGRTPEQIERVYRDIDTKRRTTRYLHLTPQLIQPVDEIKA